VSALHIVSELSSVFLAVARPTLSIDQQLGYLFKSQDTQTVMRLPESRSRTKVETDFQAVA